MLVITREIGSSVKIGDANVTVLRLNGKGVRLGIIAPKDIIITRDDAIVEHRCSVKQVDGSIGV